MSLVTRCWNAFSEAVRVGGQKLLVAHKTEMVERGKRSCTIAVDDPKDGKQTCRISASPLSLRQLELTCSCKDFQAGKMCRHLWASIVHLDCTDIEDFGDKTGPIDVVRSSGGRRPEGDEAAVQRQAREMIRRMVDPYYGGVVTKPSEDWRVRLEAVNALRGELARIEKNKQPQAAKPRQAWYRLNASATEQRGNVIVELLYSEQNKNGKWTRPKALRYAEEGWTSFVDPEDRKLLALLVGNEAFDLYDNFSLYARGRSRGVHRCALAPELYDDVLPRLCKTGRFGWSIGEKGAGEDESVQVMTWDEGDPWTFELSIRRNEERHGWEVEGRFARGEESTTFADCAAFLAPSYFVAKNSLHRLSTSTDFVWVTFLRNFGGMVVPFEQQDALLERLWKQSALPSLDLPPDLSWQQVRPTPKPRLTLEPLGPQNQHELGGVLTFDYDGWLVRASSRETSNVDANGKRVMLRDAAKENEYVAALFEAGARQVEVDIFKDFDALAPKKNLGRIVSALMPKGWHIEAAGKKVRSASLVKINVQTSVDWFELTGTVEFDGATASLPALLAAIQKGEHFITLDDGSQGMLPEEWINQYAPLAALGDASGETVKFISAQAALLDALLAAEENVDVDEAFLKIRDKLRSFAGIHPRNEPTNFIGTLRSYQREGLGWLHFLDEFGFGGCLADDMGLGKTIQVLARLTELYYPQDDAIEVATTKVEVVDGEAKTSEETATNGEALLEVESNGEAHEEEVAAVTATQAAAVGANALVAAPVGASDETAVEAVATTSTTVAPQGPYAPSTSGRRPSLVIVPRSLIQNWVEEAGRFCPRLRVLDYTGTHRKEHRKSLQNYDIIVTTYGTLRRDAPGLRKQNFEYVILDEAQAIKNQDSQAAKACRLMQGRRRLAMTGTPVENHLGELWSLFEFLNPGMLGRSATFKMFSGTGRPTDSSTLDLLVRALKPFLLRRTKEQVLTELPPKTEQTVYCELGKRQRALYDELREHYRTELGKRIESHGLKQSKIQVLEALLRLRQAACHPGLLSAKHMEVPSAKLDTLIQQLMEVLAENHKALVFSQFTSLLAIVRKRLEEANITYEYLDGRTRDRQERVDRFQKDEKCPVFLISLRAGGLGLNLTAADYVFILDPWWNPAVEAQAVDRAHRIGQARRVFAYRLIAKNTVEEKILLLQNEKRDLADAVVAADQRVLTGLTAEDLQLLLS